MAGLSPLFTWRSAIAGSDLRPTVRLVALTLSLHMGERGDSCFPSLRTLAEETGLHKETVSQALRTLQAQGYLRVRRSSGGRGRPNHYAATFPRERSTQPTVSAPAGASTRGDRSEQSAAPTLSLKGSVQPTVFGRNGRIEPEKGSAHPTGERHEDVSTSTTATASRSRPADPIWDGLVQWLGHQPETKVERDRWNAAAKQLREVGVSSAAEVTRRGRAYERAYPAAARTAWALVAHWSEFGPRADHRREIPPMATLVAHPEALEAYYAGDLERMWEVLDG